MRDRWRWAIEAISREVSQCIQDREPPRTLYEQCIAGTPRIAVPAEPPRTADEHGGGSGGTSSRSHRSRSRSGRNARR